MPKAPVLNREVFYTKLRDGSFRFLDFCLVNTSIGAMVEPRQINLVAGGKVVDSNPYDGANFTSIRELDENTFYRLTNHGGTQVPLDYQAR